MTEKYSNQLSNETSPYLLQHAHNPVDWYPWNPMALNKAHSEKKLILLSIGYSACHWCHVMAHESFENPKIANVMNALFINIKVDREERPDLDKIYQTAHQFLNQRAGGWPLTVILTPDTQIPFFAGTYFPASAKHGMPALTDILKNVHHYYQNNSNEIQEQSLSIQQIFSQINSTTQSKQSEIQSHILDEARKQLAQNFDSQFGGFGDAPKFPHPTNLERLIRHWQKTLTYDVKDEQAKKMAYITLHAMASGGIYDQLAGGFFRYSVDKKWQIPHFEKMLYDNGPLLFLYLQASTLYKNKTFERISNETANWVINKMQSRNGGYFSTLDADTNKIEGETYIWSTDEIKDILNENEFFFFSEIYGLLNKVNFDGKWHLCLSRSINDLSIEKNIPQEKILKLLTSSRKKLLKIREQRPQPNRDEKILTSWNALMIKAMMLAGRLLNNNDYIKSAQAAINFLKSNMYLNNRLFATHKDNKTHIPAYLDDYAFLIDALLESLQSEWQTDNLLFAIELADSLLNYFEDTKNGGFFFTANDHEKLIHRPKDYTDDALPSGNGIAAITLSRLGHLLANTRYIEASERCIQNAWSTISQYPSAYSAMLHAVEEYLFPVKFVFISGSNSNKTQIFKNICTDNYKPNILYFNIPKFDELLLKNYPQLVSLNNYQTENDCAAYICATKTCTPAIYDAKKLKENLISPI